MKWLGLLVITLSLSFSAIAQDVLGDTIPAVSEKRKLTKEEKKAAREKKREEKEMRKSERELEEFQRKQVNIALIREYLEDSLFVIEANTLYDRYSRTARVSPSLNFVAVRRDTLVIQIGSEFAIGPNGAGGITLEGIINKYQVTEGPGYGNLTVVLNARSPILGLATVSIKVSDTGIVWADVTGNWRQKIRMKGLFKSWESTTIFKGRTTRSLYDPY